MTTVEPDVRMWIEQRHRGDKPGVITYGGRVSFRWDSALPFDEYPYNVTIELVVDATRNRLVCEDLRFSRRVGGPVVGATRLRSARLKGIEELAAEKLSYPLHAAGAAIGKAAPPTVTDRVVARPQWRDAAVSVAEQEVIAAEIYRQTAGDYSAVVVGLRKAGASLAADPVLARGVARKRIRGARKRGLLEPASSTRPRL